MDKLCKNCRWWEDQRICGRWDSLPDMDLNDDGFAVHVQIDDDSGLWEELRTGPNFGCVHCTPKA